MRARSSCARATARQYRASHALSAGSSRCFAPSHARRVEACRAEEPEQHEIAQPPEPAPGELAAVPYDAVADWYALGRCDTSCAVVRSMRSGSRTAVARSASRIAYQRRSACAYASVVCAAFTASFASRRAGLMPSPVAPSVRSHSYSDAPMRVCDVPLEVP